MCFFRLGWLGFFTGEPCCISDHALILTLLLSLRDLQTIPATYVCGLGITRSRLLIWRLWPGLIGKYLTLNLLGIGRRFFSSTARGLLVDYLVNTKYFYSICTMSGQRRRRWPDVVEMLYKCFVFAGKMWCGDLDYCRKNNHVIMLGQHRRRCANLNAMPCVWWIP